MTTTRRESGECVDDEEENIGKSNLSIVDDDDDDVDNDDDVDVVEWDKGEMSTTTTAVGSL